MKGIKVIKLAIGLIFLVYSLIAGFNALLDELYLGFTKSHALDTPIFWGFCAVVGAALLISIKE